MGAVQTLCSGPGRQLLGSSPFSREKVPRMTALAFWSPRSPRTVREQVPGWRFYLGAFATLDSNADLRPWEPVCSVGRS